MKQTINLEAVTAFDDFLWKYSHPGECLEDWCEVVTRSIAQLSSLLEISPDLVEFPLSPVVVKWTMDMYAFYRTPLSERNDNEFLTDVYSGTSLTVDDLVEVARRVQSQIIPAQ